MYTESELAEYLAEIRSQVCSCCVARPPGGPPCAPHGKQCGVEVHLADLVGIAHATRNRAMDPYIESFHRDICAHCSNLDSKHCPCPLDSLLLLAIEAIDTVDERHGNIAAT